MRPAITQISLGINQVWSESSLAAWGNLGSSATHGARCEDWSDLVDAQADLEFAGRTCHFVSFVMWRLSYRRIFLSDVLFILQVDKRSANSTQGQHLGAAQPTPRTREQLRRLETVQQRSSVQLPTQDQTLQTNQQLCPAKLKPQSKVLEIAQRSTATQLPPRDKVLQAFKPSPPVQLTLHDNALETVTQSSVQLPPNSNAPETVRPISSVQLLPYGKGLVMVQQRSGELPPYSQALETIQQSSGQLPSYNKALETIQQSSGQLQPYSKGLETVKQSPVQLPPYKVQEIVQQSVSVQLPPFETVQESSPVQMPSNKVQETVQQSASQQLPHGKVLEAAVHSSSVQLPPNSKVPETVQQTSSLQSALADQQSYKTAIWYEASTADNSGQIKQGTDSAIPIDPPTSERQKNGDHYKVDSKRYFGANPEEPLFIRFTEKEEKNVVDFLMTLYNLGYGFTKLDMAAVTTEYAVYLRKRTRTQPIVMHWLADMIKKWPKLQLVSKKCKLTLTGILSKFFDNLESVMRKNSFDTTSERVFSVTDVEIRQDDAESDEEKILTTVIACGSAAGLSIPPFFVFPGEEMTAGLMNDALPGSSGVVTDDGLVNAEVFIQFLNEHLLKNIPEADIGKPILIHVNAVKFCSVGLVELAKKHNVTLIFPPAEITNALMPLDVGCIEPFQAEYTQECEKHIQETMTDITKNNVCGIVGKIYPKALTSNNIKEGFRKAGLFPCNRHMLILKRKT